MGIGASLFLMAAGAVLRWGVTVDARGVDLEVVGLILLIVGAVGLVLSMAFWSSVGAWAPWRRPGPEVPDLDSTAAGRATAYRDRY